MRRRKCGVSAGSTLFAIHPAILDTTVGSEQVLDKVWSGDEVSEYEG